MAGGLDDGAAARGSRILSLDILRGLVMVLMVLDHCRGMWNAGTGIEPLDPARTTPLLYFTRWITHFCAPVFVLLAGSSAFLMGRGEGLGKAALAARLASRGLVLILVELVLVSPAWGRVFFLNGLFLQVIWALGVSMVLLGALQFLPSRAIGLAGLAIIALHNLLPDPASGGRLGTLLWDILHRHGTVTLAGAWAVEVKYPLIPWVGVMFLGYALGELYKTGAVLRRRCLSAAGAACVLLFLVLRSLSVYGDPSPFVSSGPTLASLYSFLGVEKYPPSLLYLLATLGPAFLVLPLLERLCLGEGHPLLVFGRTPLFFYVVHLYLIILSGAVAMVALNALGVLRGYLDSVPFSFGLGTTYVVWLLTLAALYPVCARYRRLKTSGRHRWTGYF